MATMGLGARAGGVQRETAEERGRSTMGGASDVLYSTGAWLWGSVSSPTSKAIWDWLTLSAPTGLVYGVFFVLVVGFAVLSVLKAENDEGNKEPIAPNAIMVMPILSILMFVLVVASLWRRDGYVRHGLPLPKASSSRVMQEERSGEEERPEF